jgi:hypothetical protein
MIKNQKVIKIFSNGSLIIENAMIFSTKNQQFVFYEKDLKFFLPNEKKENTIIVELETLKYREKFFN